METFETWGRTDLYISYHPKLCIKESILLLPFIPSFNRFYPRKISKKRAVAVLGRFFEGH